jgi:hypothetical protein
MWSRFSRDFTNEIRTSVAETNGGSADVRVVPMYQPTRGGAIGILERARALLPMRQDFERPISEEILVGVPATLASEVTTAAFALSQFPPEVAAPMLVGHFGLLTAMTAYRKTMANWMTRSRSSIESLAKQGMTSMAFIINYNVVSNWPRIAADATREGALNYLTTNVPNGVAEFAVHQGPTAVLQTVFFVVTFANGVFRWEAMTSQTPALSRAARRTSAVLVPAIFWISGPALTWASTSQEILLRVGPLGINEGQAALAGLAVAGSAFWARPQILNGAIGLVDAAVYRPLAWLGGLLKSLGGAIHSGSPRSTSETVSLGGRERAECSEIFGTR